MARHCSLKQYKKGEFKTARVQSSEFNHVGIDSALPLDDFEDFIAVHNSESGIGRFKATVFLVQMEWVQYF